MVNSADYPRSVQEILNRSFDATNNRLRTDIGSATQTFDDDILLRLGTDGDQVLVNRSTALAADTALTNALVGTVRGPALAANSLIVSNVTASGDTAFYGNFGGSSNVFMHFDASVPMLNIFNQRLSSGLGSDFGIVVNDTLAIARFWTGAGSAAPYLHIHRAAGTRAAPTGVLANYGIGEISFTGYNGVGGGSLEDVPPTGYGNAAEIRVVSISDFSATNSGARLLLLTTADGVWSTQTVRVSVDSTATVFGTTTTYGGLAPQTIASAVSGLQLLGLNGGRSQMAVVKYGAESNGSFLTFGMSRGTTIGAIAALVNLDFIGGLQFVGADTTDLNTVGAFIYAQITGTPAANRMPTTLRFYTAAGAADNDIAEKMRLSPVGNLILGNVSVTVGTGAVQNLILGQQNSAVLGGALADLIHIANVDFAPGDARLYIQSELGSRIILGNNTLTLGLAGTGTGSLTMSGATSGVVTVTVAAVAGTWTMTLPTGVAGTAGFQLTDAGANGVTSWSGAGSLRAYKDILPENQWLRPQDALDRILHTRVPAFHYKPGMGTLDMATRYDGVMAEEAPWAMHYQGGVLNPINAFGYTVLAIQAHEDEITSIKRQMGKLQERLATLEGAKS